MNSFNSVNVLLMKILKFFRLKNTFSSNSSKKNFLKCSVRVTFSKDKKNIRSYLKKNILQQILKSRKVFSKKNIEFTVFFINKRFYFSTTRKNIIVLIDSADLIDDITLYVIFTNLLRKEYLDYLNYLQSKYASKILLNKIIDSLLFIYLMLPAFAIFPMLGFILINSSRHFVYYFSRNKYNSYSLDLLSPCIIPESKDCPNAVTYQRGRDLMVTNFTNFRELSKKQIVDSYETLRREALENSFGYKLLNCVKYNSQYTLKDFLPNTKNIIGGMFLAVTGLVIIQLVRYTSASMYNANFLTKYKMINYLKSINVDKMVRASRIAFNKYSKIQTDLIKTVNLENIDLRLYSADFEELVYIETKNSLNRFIKEKITYGFKENYYKPILMDNSVPNGNVLDFTIYDNNFGSHTTSLAEPLGGYTGDLEVLFKHETTVGGLQNVIYTRQRYQYRAYRSTIDGLPDFDVDIIPKEVLKQKALLPKNATFIDLPQKVDNLIKIKNQVTTVLNKWPEQFVKTIIKDIDVSTFPFIQLYSIE